MRLIKRLIELAFFVFLLSLFGKNMDLSLPIKYYGLQQPITVQFWEVVIFCVACGIIIAALGDFITQLKWLSERRRMIKTDREHHSEVQALTEKVRALEADNTRAEKELDAKTKAFEETSVRLQKQTLELEQVSRQLEAKTQDFEHVSRQLEVKTQELAMAQAKETADAEDSDAKAESVDRDERA